MTDEPSTPGLDSRPPTTAAELSGHMRRGSAWMVGMSWTVRLMGLASTVVLARLLIPDDFGIFAMGMLLVGFCEVMARSGQEMAVIRHAEPAPAHLDAAWTLSILVSFGLGLLVVLAAPLIASAFHEPRAELAIYILAIRVFFIGFENIGTAMFRRELDFAADFRFGVYHKLGTILLTVSLALWLRSYWALIAGSIFGQLVTIVISYRMHPFRPRLSVAKLPEIWRFSSWVLVERLANYFTQRLDRFIVGGMGTTAGMGLYHVGTELGRMPTFDTLQSITRALFPNYVRLVHDSHELKKAYLSVLGLLLILALALGAGFALVAEPFVALVYGAKWVPAAPIVSFMSITAIFMLLSAATVPVQLAAGRSRAVAGQSLIRVAILALALGGAVASSAEVAEIAAARTAATALAFPTFLYFLSFVIPLRGRDLFALSWRPVLATAAMAGVVSLVADAAAAAPLALLLLVEIGAGAAAFTATLLGLWALAGFPEGAERAVLSYLGARVGRPFPHPRIGTTKGSSSL